MATKTKNSSLLSLLLLLILLVVGIFWFKPNFDDVNALKSNEQAKQEIKKNAENTLQTLKDAQANLDQAGEINRETVLVAIPEKYEQDKLITIINNIANQNRVNIGSISFTVPLAGNSTQEELRKSTISVSLTGDENDLLKFLRGIENSSRKMIVKGITVQYGQTAGLERINFSISMETYFQNGI